MLNWALIVIGFLVVLLLVVVIVGYFFPREHVATSSIVLAHPPDSVWMAVRDIGGTAEWWPDVRGVGRIERPDGREAWRQDLKSGPLALLVIEDDPPRRLVMQIDVPADAAFGGTWTYEVIPKDGGARVRITEAGFINNPLFRLMANVFFGMHGTMDRYLTALGRKFDTDVTPEHASADRLTD